MIIVKNIGIAFLFLIALYYIRNFNALEDCLMCFFFCYA